MLASLFFWLCHSTWLFCFSNILKLYAFSNFPLVGSVIGRFYWLFPWNFKEKSINRFLWHSLSFQGCTHCPVLFRHRVFFHEVFFWVTWRGRCRRSLSSKALASGKPAATIPCGLFAEPCLPPEKWTLRPFREGRAIENGRYFISWNSKGIANKMPPTMKPISEKLKKLYFQHIADIKQPDALTEP